MYNVNCFNPLSLRKSSTSKLLVVTLADFNAVKFAPIRKEPRHRNFVDGLSFRYWQFHRFKGLL